jgi:hypothetical protein
MCDSSVADTPKSTPTLDAAKEHLLVLCNIAAHDVCMKACTAVDAVAVELGCLLQTYA